MCLESYVHVRLPSHNDNGFSPSPRGFLLTNPKLVSLSFFFVSAFFLFLACSFFLPIFSFLASAMRSLKDMAVCRGISSASWNLSPDRLLAAWVSVCPVRIRIFFHSSSFFFVYFVCRQLSHSASLRLSPLVHSPVYIQCLSGLSLSV